MAFIIYLPLGQKAPITLKTSNALVRQLWQEFIMLRHLSKPKNIKARKAIAPWIDQAKTYFLDASSADWRSSGLLYYYSFLNLAKAFIVAKRLLTYNLLDTTAIYHGLHAELQSISELTEFEIQIFPPIYKGRNNVFSYFYEAVTNEKWPYKDKVTITVADIAGYCSDISAELLSLYKIGPKTVVVQSLVRDSKNQSWFEMLVPDRDVNIIKGHLPTWLLEEISPSRFSGDDKNDWLLSLRRTAASLRRHACLRGPKKPYKESNRSKILSSVAKEAMRLLEPYALPTVYEQADSPQWLFIPDLTLLGKSIRWHPVLSDCLIGFVLSTILRYQPQLLNPKSHNYFLAEAWCSQSPITALRYFLMLFTHPPLRIETY
ncbi:MAG: YaaC family protein [Deltaproteobacteria bacterium]|nr:YaaC family protein [Deltaproteobacteria bacterium]